MRGPQLIDSADDKMLISSDSAGETVLLTGDATF